MALRVLLADESTTIKKVMQLALQDFAVEVKAVHVGVDVVEVARSFQPDIIFADVLLQKRNGYDVCADIKNDPELKALPVVLMWSSFMDLDEKAAAQSGADNRLEKPFDVESLRQLVLELVPKTRSQRLAHFLKFPETFAQPLKEEERTKQQQTRPAEPAPIAMQPSQPHPATAVKPTTVPPTVSVPPTASAPPPLTPAKPAAPIPMPPPVATAPTPKPKATVPPPPLTPPAGRQASSTVTSIPVPPPPTQKTPLVPPQAKPAPQAEAPKSTWNMESFEDMSNFEDSTPSFENAAHSKEPADDDQFDFSDDPADEVFSEFKLTDLTGTRKPRDADAAVTNAAANATPAKTEPSDEEPWSHQDLSAFKIDLPPVAVEGEDFSLSFDISQRDPEGTGFTINHRLPEDGIEDSTNSGTANARDNISLDDERTLGFEEIELPDPYAAQAQPEEMPMDSGIDPRSSHDLEEIRLIEMPEGMSLEMEDLLEVEEPVRINPLGGQLNGMESALAGTISSPDDLIDDERTQESSLNSPRARTETTKTGPVPQLSADQLEEIIRSQSKEIIESVVRRIVPDIASNLIKQELQRLLEETAVRSEPTPPTNRPPNRENRR